MTLKWALPDYKKALVVKIFRGGYAPRFTSITDMRMVTGKMYQGTTEAEPGT